MKVYAEVEDRAPLCKSCLHERDCGERESLKCKDYRDKYKAKFIGVPTSDGWVMVC